MTTSRRIALAVLKAGTTSLFGQQPTAKQTPPKIVFICEHGAAKSVIATAELKRLAKERGRLLNVESRGTNPDAQIAADVRHGLKADGMDLGDAKPAKVSAKDLDGATTVVSFGPDLSPLLPKDQFGKSSCFSNQKTTGFVTKCGRCPVPGWKISSSKPSRFPAFLPPGLEAPGSNFRRTAESRPSRLPGRCRRGSVLWPHEASSAITFASETAAPLGSVTVP